MIESILGDIGPFVVCLLIELVFFCSICAYIKKAGRVEHRGPYMTFQTRTDERYELPQASYPQEMIVHKPKVEHYEPSELLLRSIDIYFCNRYGIPTSPDGPQLPLSGPNDTEYPEH